MSAQSYFAATSWGDLEKINALLCQTAGQKAGPAADGGQAARTLWEAKHDKPLSFLTAADLCRECHRLAPFQFLNGNTFASCARVALASAMARLSGLDQTFARAALGHYIAGTITREELLAIIPPALWD